MLIVVQSVPWRGGAGAELIVRQGWVQVWAHAIWMVLTKRQNAKRLLNLDADLLDAQQQEANDSCRRYHSPLAGFPQGEWH